MAEEQKWKYFICKFKSESTPQAQLYVRIWLVPLAAEKGSLKYNGLGAFYNKLMLKSEYHLEKTFSPYFTF